MTEKISELIAKDYDKNGNIKNNNKMQHEYMGDLVEAMARSLSVWDNHTETLDYYKNLSWAGLETSTAYDKLSKTKKTQIQNTIKNERFNKNGAKGTKCK